MRSAANIPEGATIETLAHKLKRRRLMEGYTQRLLAEATGMHQTTISLIECGKVSPRPSTVGLLAAQLYCDPEDLWGCA